LHFRPLNFPEFSRCFSCCPALLRLRPGRARKRDCGSMR
jgi:hypothetical protein